jgi:predicted RecB family nuclease
MLPDKHTTFAARRRGRAAAGGAGPGGDRAGAGPLSLLAARCSRQAPARGARRRGAERMLSARAVTAFAPGTAVLARGRRRGRCCAPLCRRLVAEASATADVAPKPPRKAVVLRSTTHMLRFRRSRFAAHLSELRLRGAPAPAPDPPSRIELALAAAGDAHERCVLACLVEQCAGGAAPAVIPRNDPNRYRLTADALRDGVPIVHQPALSDGELLDGYADVLLRNSHNPFLPPGGVYPDEGYSVVEVKLASTVRAEYVLQAAAYTDMLARVSQSIGLPPPGPPFLWLGSAAAEPLAVPPADAAYFYRSVRRAFADFVRTFDAAAPWPAIDAPVGDLSPWAGAARGLIQRTDALLQVAGIRRSQARALERAGVTTMRQLAEMSVEQVVSAVDSIGRAPLESLQRQAVLQVASREQSKPSAAPVFEVVDVPTPAPHGLHRLPPRSPQDVFFDMEGFPLVPGGLEYLFGASFAGDGRHACSEFRAWWAHDRAAEEAQFAAFVGWLRRRWQQCARDAMHVFHYGHYEVTAMRRIACRAVTGDGVQAGVWLEDMLEAGLFVDVYKVVKASLRIGEPSYSIKNVERLVGVSREGDELADAESSVAMYYEWRRLAGADAGDGAGSLLRGIESYNRQDCESLDRIVRWLRRVAMKHGIAFSPWQPPASASTARGDGGDGDGGDRLARGACGATPARKATDSSVIRRGEQLSVDLLGRESSPLQQVLAHLVGFHVRETAPARGRFGDRVARAAAGDVASAFHDDQCISRVWRDSAAAPGGGGSNCAADGRGRPTSVYQFDPCEPHRLQLGDSCAFVRMPSASATQGAAAGEGGVEMDPVAGFARVREASAGSVGLDFGKRLALPDGAPHRGALVSSDELIICPSAMRASILDIAVKVQQKRDLPPLVSSYLRRIGYLDASDGDDADGSRLTGDGRAGRHHKLSRQDLGHVIARLRGRTFVIQGPPGTGKTVTSASLITDLVVKHGKTVAVSSNSHAAIDNLLERAVRNGTPPQSVVKVGPKSPALDHHGVGRLTSARDVTVAALDGAKAGKNSKSACLVGATAYALSSADVTGKFDYLFVDEAGQVPMANFVAMAPCATSAVLVGDQQQLDMPLQGQHPDSVSKSCLTYFLGDNVATVPSSLGVFLETSYRMAPALCAFVSRTMYNSALRPAAGTAEHVVRTRPAPLSVEDNVARDAQLPPPLPSLLPARAELSGLVFIDRDRHTLSVAEASKLGRGNHRCPTEVRLTRCLIDELLGAEFSAKGAASTLDIGDIMVVAPYNAQVAAIRAASPDGTRVGTIDKFQGQEAPVVIVSTCALPEGDFDDLNDDADAAALDSGIRHENELATDHGTWFALQRKRLNVALSRAQCLAIVIGPAGLATRAKARSLDDASVLAFYGQIVEAGRRGADGATQD